ncbi:hypothetical protein ATV_gp31 [Bicaudavirus pozzuoliense]|uniref:Uncharacterized protein ORF155 n=2 Tax=Acidianus two-tailed virus TaxID=315953 RepID=Y155_ATV|nr:hypothetical protein ATV_gp31 [Acidianus two-tailed virus]Q3V4S0.1 RecName: Full=Uncharacterized protein ORF155 [Acidianus two-tailed virus]AON96509.1 hypothetical protein [Acidianus two-tailed phage variant 1]CAI59894.1 hypothetical protein [Acidianus two-tailed virus]
MPGQTQKTPAFTTDQFLDLINRLFGLDLAIVSERNIPLIINRLDDINLKLLLAKMMVNGMDEFIPFRHSPEGIRSINVEQIPPASGDPVDTPDYRLSIEYKNGEQDNFICTYDETKWKCTARDVDEITSIIGKRSQANSKNDSNSKDDLPNPFSV